MKVLLIAANLETLPDPVFPLGLACVAGALKAAGIDCRVVDLCFADDFRESLGCAINEAAPDLVGLSIRNVDNVSYPNYMSYLPFYRQVVRYLRQVTRARIVLGGSGFSLLPQQLIQYLEADFGIVGEGETAMVKLAESLAAEPGTKGRGRIIRAPLCRPDRLAGADRSGFDNQAYFRLGGMGSIQTKRGCPFRCIYCTYPLIEGRKIRLRSPQAICDEIEDLLARGMDTLFFVDNTFNFPPEHAAAVCGEIIRRSIKVAWSCYANPGFVTPQLVELMQRAGCSGLEFGTDAADPGMLEQLGKGFSVAELHRASKICRHQGMKFCHSLLLGGPSETMDSVKRTLDEVCAMQPTAAICMLGIRLFPGTALAAIARDQGLVTGGQDYLGPVFYLSKAVSGRIVPYVESFARDNPRWIFPGLNINIDRNLQRKLRRFGVKGPLWEYMQVRAGSNRGRKNIPPSRPDTDNQG